MIFMTQNITYSLKACSVTRLGASTAALQQLKQTATTYSSPCFRTQGPTSDTDGDHNTETMEDPSSSLVPITHAGWGQNMVDWLTKQNMHNDGGGLIRHHTVCSCENAGLVCSRAAPCSYTESALCFYNHISLMFCLLNDPKSITGFSHEIMFSKSSQITNHKLKSWRVLCRDRTARVCTIVPGGSNFLGWLLLGLDVSPFVQPHGF